VALPITIWDEALQQQLRPFTESDFLARGMSSAEKNGVHVKEFLTDPSGGGWVAKSGALAEAFPSQHDAAVERGRRIAFPINEVIAALLYRQAGIAMDVGLGTRTMFNHHFATKEPLLTSFHEMQRGTLRCKLGTFERSERYLEDVLCVACLDVIMGQRDHKPHNYMVTIDGRLFPFDNSDCMHEEWLHAACSVGLFEDVKTHEPDPPAWTDGFRESVVTRMASITSDVVDAVFGALPEAIIQAHDASLGAAPYVAGSLWEKRARLKANLQVFRHWADQFTNRGVP
jgi:hypothetical protein